MSEPRHVWLDIDEQDEPHVCEWFTEFPAYAWVRRYTLTDGDEYRALIERAREALASPYAIAPLERSQSLRDLLAYLGETP